MEQVADDGAENIEIATEEQNFRKTATFTLTAYCACSKCCGKWADGITASGTVATEGRTVAVDRNIVPMGSKLEIEGIGTRIAEDTGSGVNGNHIDIFFEDHQRALNFGVQKKQVKILN